MPTPKEIPKPSPNSIPQLENDSLLQKNYPPFHPLARFSSKTLLTILPSTDISELGVLSSSDCLQTQAASFSSRTADSKGCAHAWLKKFKDPYGDWHCPAEERNGNVAEQVN
jgi:hypothetical protein